MDDEQNLILVSNRVGKSDTRLGALERSLKRDGMEMGGMERMIGDDECEGNDQRCNTL